MYRILTALFHSANIQWLKSFIVFVYHKVNMIQKLYSTEYVYPPQYPHFIFAFSTRTYNSLIISLF